MQDIQLKLDTFQPDLQDNANLLQATNVLFREKGITPHNAFKSASDTVIDASVTKSAQMLDSTFLLGKGLYELRGGFTVVDRTKTGLDFTTDFIEAVEFNNKILVTDYFNNIQQLSLSASADKTTDLIDFKAKSIAVVKNFVFAGNIKSSDGNDKYLVRWSGIGDETKWSASASTQSGQQQLIHGGSINKIVGGEHATIFLDTAIYRASYVGGSFIFTFHQLENNGCTVPNSVVKKDNNIFFLSRDGWRVTNGGSVSVNIGSGTIDEWFYETWNNDEKTINAVSIPASDFVYWSFVDKNDKKRVLVYNQKLQKFSTLSFDFDAIIIYKVPPTNIEQITTSIDDQIGSFDDTTLQQAKLGIIHNGKLKVVDGDRYLPSTIQTGFIDLGLIRNVTKMNPDNNHKTDIQGRLRTKLYSDSDVNTYLWVSNHPQTFDINTRGSGRKISAELKFQNNFGILNSVKLTVTGASKR